MAPVREKVHGAGTTGTTGAFRPSLRDGFTVSFVLSLGIGCLAPIARTCRQATLANLTSASRGQDHTTSPSTQAPVVYRPLHVHRIPAPTFVTTRTPLCDEA